ncbi:MAG: helix-turn-helix domain-containing protein, partial [Deltaproteobacteria bacterium]|nr:helix-turn-helix domain-containing protein [Deltaproteobacteria bacterium]
MVRRDKSDYVIQSVSHSLDVLEQFFGVSGEIGVTELSKRLKLHKNNVFRLLATLEARGYIEQNKGTENYRLGLKCLHLGQTYAHQMGFLLQAKAILDELAKSSDESSFVAV